MVRAKIWLQAARPKTLWAAVAPVLIGTVMAWSDNRFDGLIALLTFAATILIQIGTNFANDYYDFIKGADTGDRIGPQRITQSGLVEPRTTFIAFSLLFTLAFVCGLYLIYTGGWPILVIGILSIAFGILYTGGPYPLGYNGLGDLFVLIFFGPVAVAGTYYLQAHTITWPVFLAGFSPGLLSTALLTVNNLRDIHTDKKAGKRTLAVRFGAGFARWEYLFSVMLACTMPVFLLLLTRDHPFSLATLLILGIAIPMVRSVFSMEIGPGLNEILGKTGRLLFIYSVVFSIGWLI